MLFPYMRGWTYKVKGTCQWLEGRKAQAVKTWEKGIAYLRENTKDTYRLATLLLEEASFLLKDNPEDKKASEYLIEAKEIFEQLGAKLDLERTNKLLRAISPEEDALSQDWSGICWMNPPYGRQIGRWIEKAYLESQRGATVGCLIPARTDTRYWWDWVRLGEIRFLKGRLKFSNAADAPFPSAIVIFERGRGSQVIHWRPGDNHD